MSPRYTSSSRAGEGFRLRPLQADKSMYVQTPTQFPTRAPTPESARTQHAAWLILNINFLEATTAFGSSGTTSCSPTYAFHSQSTEYQTRTKFQSPTRRLHALKSSPPSCKSTRGPAQDECAQLRRALAQQTYPTRTRAHRLVEDRAECDCGAAV
ncbi:hypothetical protein C8J57DRAFT_1241199 [Mycena rebaudengoi]|nr:hypothetical protein C8J57DRAFT_1241199 [Mycena rebaudengoi]